jgi:hypothetical protein
MNRLSNSLPKVRVVVIALESWYAQVSLLTAHMKNSKAIIAAFANDRLRIGGFAFGPGPSGSNMPELRGPSGLFLQEIRICFRY